MLILAGLVIGFLASVPPGPINLLALSQALNHEFRRSLAVGSTAALLDFFYCYAAMIGASAVSSFLMSGRTWIRLVGVLVLIAVARHLLLQARSVTSKASHPPRSMSFLRLIGLAFTLYVSSPTLAAFWVSIAAFITAHGLGARQPGGPLIFALSCGAGSCICYMGIARYGSRLRKALNPRIFRMVQTVLAIALIGMAIVTLVETLTKLR
jgi:L-lysine exporter family protein LysE/ArgO